MMTSLWYLFYNQDNWVTLSIEFGRVTLAVGILPCWDWGDSILKYVATGETKHRIAHFREKQEVVDACLTCFGLSYAMAEDQDFRRDNTPITSIDSPRKNF